MPAARTSRRPANRVFTASLSLPSCRFRKDDLVRIYELINERQYEYGTSFVEELKQQEDESDEGFGAA
jgi:hypothetical protein